MRRLVLSNIHLQSNCVRTPLAWHCSNAQHTSQTTVPCICTRLCHSVHPCTHWRKNEMNAYQLRNERMPICKHSVKTWSICVLQRLSEEFNTGRMKLMLFAKTLSCVNDQIVLMAIFTAWAKIYSSKYFCNAKVGRWVGQNFCPVKLFRRTVLLLHLNEQWWVHLCIIQCTSQPKW